MFSKVFRCAVELWNDVKSSSKHFNFSSSVRTFALGLSVCVVYIGLIGLHASLSHLLEGKPSLVCFNGRGQHILRCHRLAVAE